MTSIRTERVKVPYSPREKAVRIKRCARALQQEITVKALRDIYTNEEIALARAMIGRTRDPPTICANCNEPFSLGEQIKKDADGRWRHPSKCGAELDDLKVRKPRVTTQ